jgi:hypothetical protein
MVMAYGVKRRDFKKMGALLAAAGIFVPDVQARNIAQSNAASFEPVLAAGRCAFPAPVQWFSQCMIWWPVISQQIALQTVVPPAPS